MPFVDESGSPVDLSPQDQSAYWQSQGGQAPGTLVDDQGKPVDPFSLPAKDIADLVKSAPDKFDLISQFSARPDLQKDPAMVDKVADAFHQVREQPTDWGALAKAAPKNITNVFAGLGRFALKAVSGTGKELVSGAIGALTNTPETADVVATGQEESRRELGEVAAASELGATGLVSGAIKTAQALGRGLHISKQLKDYDEADKRNALFDALARTTQSQEIASGKGPIAQAVTGGYVPVNPEEVSKLQDPFSWEALGGATKLAGAALPSAAPVLAKAGEKAANIGGKAVTVAAKAGELAAKGVEKTSPVIGGVSGAAAGAHVVPIPVVGHFIGAVEGATRGAEFAHKFVTPVTKKLGEVAQLGKQISGTAPLTSPYAVAARNALQVAPTAAVELGKGVAFDASQVAGADTPQEREAAVGLGAAFGLLGAANVAGRHVISGQLIRPRDYPVSTPVKSSGAFPELDALHDANFANLTDGQKARLNATRLFLSKAAPGTDIFVTGENPEASSAALQSIGMSPEQADFYAQQKGFAANVNGRKIIGVQEPGAAPHEASHGLEDVLGEAKMRELDNVVKQQYAGDWEKFGRYYASRLTGSDPGADWRSPILDASGWGNVEAVEKLYRETANKFVDEAQKSGQPAPTEEQIKDAVRASGPVDWRTTLTPEEQTAAADRYIAREKLAENFDAAFKHLGPTLEPGKSLPDKIGRVLGLMMEVFGANPLAGKTSEGLGVPLNPEVISKVSAAGRGVLPDVTAAPILAGKEKVAPMVAPVGAAASTAVADNARKLAQNQPDVPLPGQNQSQREIAGAAAEAFANDSGLHLQYSSAPDEPAASLSQGMNRNDRRSMVEAFREMPDSARKLFGKLFFPKKFVQTKSSGLQIQGWSPEVFAANAHRWGKFVAENGLASPYEVDAKGLTEKGWQDLYSDLQNFVASHRAGKTGAGESLVVPKKVTEAGYFAPPTVGKTGAPLDQGRADVINMLFGFKLPGKAGEPTRAGGGATRLPQNIAGRLVSEATQPGRTSVPVEPRGAFGGGAAERQGIAGEPVTEVNPYRAELEAAAKAKGVAAPSMIESWQNLNLSRIKEAQTAPEQPKFGANPLTLQAGFLPSERTPVELEGPDGKKYKATFDGYQDFSSIGRGQVPQFTALEDLPGSVVAKSTTYGPSLEKAGYKFEIPQAGKAGLDVSASNQTERGTQFQPQPWEHKPSPALSDEGKALEAKGFRFGHGSNENLFHGVTIRDADGKVVGTAQGSRWTEPDRAAIGDVVTNAGQPVAEGLRAELKAYLNSRGYPKVDDFSQFSPANDRKYAGYEEQRAAYEATPWWKKPFVGESETGRHSSFVGDAERGVVLHSAKQRSTVFLNPERAEGFLKEVGAAKTPEAKDEAIESYFTKGSGTGVEGQFSPAQRRSKDDYKLPEGGPGLFVKAWITPEGKPIQLGDQQHHDWLNEHPEVKKKYGIKRTDEDNRVEALTKGFARVNYEKNTGTLKVEARAADWPKVKDAVREIAKTNLPRIDNMDVHLLDTKAKKIVASDGVQLHSYEPEEKMDQLPFIGTAGGVTEVSPQASAAKTVQFSPETASGLKLPGENEEERKQLILNQAQDSRSYLAHDYGYDERAAKLWSQIKIPSPAESIKESPIDGGSGIISPDGRMFKASPFNHFKKLVGLFPELKPFFEEDKAATAEAMKKQLKQYERQGEFVEGHEYEGAPESFSSELARLQELTFANSGWVRIAPVRSGGKLVRLEATGTKEGLNRNLKSIKDAAIMSGLTGEPTWNVGRQSGDVFLNPIEETSREKVLTRAFFNAAKTKPEAMIGGQYLPAAEPRALRSAAVRDPETGQIFEAPFHAMAVQHALGLDTYKGMGEKVYNSFEHGFTTNEGEFLSREESHKRAEEMRQLAEGRDVTQSPSFQKKGGIGIEHLSMDTLRQMDENRKAAAGQFMPETRWHGKEREGEKEHDWNELSNQILNPMHRTPFNEGKAPDVSLDDLKKEGYKTVDWAETPTFHDHTTRAVFYKSDRGQFPLTEGGVRQASDAALKQEKAIQAIAYPPDSGQFSPADSAGVTNRKDVADARKEWKEKGVESPYFKKWFGDSKVVDSDGAPAVVYHGTTHKFSAFGDKRNNPENSLGAGHYFTTDENDASGNYGNVFGPDLQNRISALADSLEISKAQATRHLAGRTERVIPAYLKLENPVVLDREGNTSTRFDYQYDDNTSQETGTSIDLYNSLLRVAQQHGVDGQKIWNDLTQNGADDLNAYDVWKGIKGSDAALDANDPEGRLVGSEIARQVFEDMGFDGIELTHPAKEFPGMNLDEDTKHFVVFKPEQIKGVENRGTFSHQDPRYQFLPMERNTSEEDIKTARQFWVTNKGVTHPAWGGHQDEAQEAILPSDFISKLPPAQQLSEDSHADAVYAEMRKQGHVRGLYRRFPDHLDFTGTPYGQLSVPAQKEITRLSQSLNLPAVYNGRDLDTGVEGKTRYEAQFLPPAKPEDFKNADSLPKALHGSQYAILTANKEANGSAMSAANLQANDNLEKALIADGYNPHPVSGAYKGVDQGKNFLVPGMSNEEAVKYAKQYGQESVLTPHGLMYADGSVNPAVPEKTIVGAEAKKQDGWSQVAGGPPFSMGIDFDKRVQFSPQTDLFGAPMAEEKKAAGLSSFEKGQLTKEGLAKQYPEVVLPKKRDQAIPSDILGSPLYKKAVKEGGEPAAVNAFADRLVSLANEYKDHPSFKDGAAWYDHIAPAIDKAFGKTGQLFAELLAATSPGQTPDLNFRDALQAHDRIVAGDYDKQVAKYHQGLEMAENEKQWKSWLTKHGRDLPANPTPETFLGQWIDFHDLTPTKLNGKRYGHNSVPVLNVAARKWIQDAGPKTSNFVKNLLGTGHEATIDLWADRTMRWAGYQGQKERWRILPENKSGVDDKDFAFAQKTFAEAAKRLNMRPDQLQGALWFAEKQRWADNGWSPLNLGTYEPEFARIPEHRAKVAQEQQLRDLGARVKPLTGAQTELRVEPRKIL